MASMLCYVDDCVFICRMSQNCRIDPCFRMVLLPLVVLSERRICRDGACFRERLAWKCKLKILLDLSGWGFRAYLRGRITTQVEKTWVGFTRSFLKDSDGDDGTHVSLDWNATLCIEFVQILCCYILFCAVFVLAYTTPLSPLYSPVGSPAPSENVVSFASIPVEFEPQVLLLLAPPSSPIYNVVTSPLYSPESATLAGTPMTDASNHQNSFRNRLREAYEEAARRVPLLSDDVIVNLATVAMAFGLFKKVEVRSPTRSDEPEEIRLDARDSGHTTNSDDEDTTNSVNYSDKDTAENDENHTPNRLDHHVYIHLDCCGQQPP